MRRSLSAQNPTTPTIACYQDDVLEKMIHRFEQGKRVCQCGGLNIPEGQMNYSFHADVRKRRAARAG